MKERDDLGTWWMLGGVFALILLILTAILSLLVVVHNN